MNIRNINAQNRTAAIGVSFDVPNEREVIAIGSPENLKSYFTMGILSDEIDVRTRKLGSLVEDMNELAKGDCDSCDLTSIIIKMQKDGKIRNK